mgnify:CR=1 FL=1|tara:strand:- start:1648 stop:2163 length:516 start_codon:yes stop_codon:yes gene_type:complete
MYNINLENKLISPDIVDIMSDYVSLQLDIDSTKIKAAALVAQKVDIGKIIGKTNLERVQGIDLDDPSVPEVDKDLYELLLAPWCYFTFGRCLRMFQGAFTDSGFVIEEGAESRNAAKSVSSEMSAIGLDFMTEVIEFLENETPDVAEDMDEIKIQSTGIRTFGGLENRASN